MNNIEIVYYLGVFGIIFIEGYLLFIKFAEYDEINLKEHIWMILLYIIILIVLVIVWRLMFNFIFHLQDMINSNNDISIEDYK